MSTERSHRLIFSLSNTVSFVTSCSIAINTDQHSVYDFVVEEGCVDVSVLTIIQIKSWVLPRLGITLLQVRFFTNYREFDNFGTVDGCWRVWCVYCATFASLARRSHIIDYVKMTGVIRVDVALCYEGFAITTRSRIP